MGETDSNGFPIGSAAVGLYELIKGRQEEKRLNKMGRPNFDVDPALAGWVSEAYGRRNQGFTPAETAAFNNQMANATASNYYKANNTSGGSLSQTIMAILSGQEQAARTQFAMKNADLARNNFNIAGNAVGTLQNQINRSTEQDIQDYVRRMIAANQTFNAGLQNMTDVGNVIGARLGSQDVSLKSILGMAG